MTVIWLPAAEQDRLTIGNIIAADNPAAASRMDELFMKASYSLEYFPERARAGVIPGTRELLVHPSYKLIYEIEGEDVYILAVVHTSRLWPPLEAD
ncbi:MAG TPA: type II toxin-antitoxin system RelE/ParE family toxin [Ochrobactrum sp.]|nr:type II toxin-antitoxin system RelE/ParE family toxin [Ochrobactrum sp.]